MGGVARNLSAPISVAKILSAREGPRKAGRCRVCFAHFEMHTFGMQYLKSCILIANSQKYKKCISL